MSNTVIKVENLSKRYQLGTFGYGSLQHDLAALWARVRGKEDPNTKIGETSRFDRHGEFWALKDVSFEVKQGDRLGILGRNGAGKSTLLKILSRVTGPTSGRALVKGRVASLLEVGTGFNPELTGRENVYLNGAIMGMKRFEIRRKFDEIVEFSGIPQFIDTPVKRYSSGMKVKLAFAVAAHLDSEILIADEVLAVGDAEFQKKSLGKMEDISTKQGRTVLFVSHHLAPVRNLCTTGIILSSGCMVQRGDIDSVISGYLSSSVKESQLGPSRMVFQPTDSNGGFLSVTRRINGAVVDTDTLDFDDFLEFELVVRLDRPQKGPIVKVSAFVDGELTFGLLSSTENRAALDEKLPGEYTYTVKIPAETFRVGKIEFSFSFGRLGHQEIDHLDRIFPMTVTMTTRDPLSHQAAKPKLGRLNVKGIWTEVKH